MVKGVSKQVVVVKPPQGLFEEAIFILKEDAKGRVGTDAEQVLREACAVANDYVSEHCERQKTRFAAPLCFGIGAGLVSLAWALSAIL